MKRVLLLSMFLLRPDVVVERAVPPVHPAHMDSGGLAVFEIRLTEQGRRVSRMQLYGEAPFSSEALTALFQWKLTLPGGRESGHINATFLFRPRGFPPMELLKEGIRPASPSESGPVPLRIADPGYPPGASGSGFVILDLEIDAEGNVNAVREVWDDTRFTALARAAIVDWKFAPARHAGKAESGSAVVVVSFVDPNSE
jgi:hypothetical protein